jgi:lipase chaperone LimK
MQGSTARIGLGLLVLALIGAGLAFWPGSDSRDAVVLSPQTQIGKPTVPFARSLLDTEPDGNLQALQSTEAVGAPGRLAYGELRRLFDYYLSTVGEQTIEAITAHIRGELQRNLPPAQVPKAQRLLALYIEFKRELVELDGKPELAGGGVAAIRKRMLAQQDLRARYFSNDEVQGMFGFEDAYDMDAVARLEVSQNPALTPLEKQQQLAALDAAMPETLRREREASHGVVRVEQQVAELRAKGASDDDIYRMRAKEFDAQAAARLADVDREEAAWKSRIARYRDERSKVLQNLANAPESERQTALAQLQQSLFSEAERPRLVAYE